MHHWIQAVAAVLVLSMLGCEAVPEAPVATTTSASVATRVAAPSTSSGTASGAVETTEGSYSFSPVTCVIHREGDVLDIEAGGPGKAPNGEKIYVEFSSTANELSIDVGVDTPFASSERTLKAGQFVSKKMQVEVLDKTIRVAELELVDEQGNRRPGSLEIKC